MPNREDVMFARMMIAHHEQALKMAERQLAMGSDMRLKAFANKVRDDQSREIADLQMYLGSLGVQP